MYFPGEIDGEVIIVNPSNNCNRNIDNFPLWFPSFSFSLVYNRASYHPPKVCDYQMQFENGDPWDSETTDTIARIGDLDTMKYVHEHGCPWASTTTATIATRGDLDLLKYVHERGCPWSPSTLTKAVIKGNLDCLRYAHEHGCTWEEDTMGDALCHSQIECVKYLYEHGCELDNDSMDCVRNLECMKYVYERGCPWTEKTRFILSVSRDQANMQRYMYDHGCPGVQAKLTSVDIAEKDITLVIDQAHCTREEALNALVTNDGDLVNAIMELTI